MVHHVKAGCPRALHWAPFQCVFLWPKARPGMCFWRPRFHARVNTLALCAESLAWSTRHNTPSSLLIQSPSQVWGRKARLHSSNGYPFLLSLLRDPGKGSGSLANDISFLRAQNAQETLLTSCGASLVLWRWFKLPLHQSPRVEHRNTFVDCLLNE